MYKKLKLHLIEEKFALSKLPQFSEVPLTVTKGDMCFFFRTENELTLLTPEFMAPNNVQQEIGWRCIRVEEELKLTEPGIVSSLTAPLAVANIPILLVTTFDTVYTFFREEHVVQAIQALQNAGHEFRHKG
ncbi:MAG TPA: ACT domain-containing protein [Bacteroidota bacterium]|nr:ACT domain-containing protein [Bacteroidota bacterium]